MKKSFAIIALVFASVVSVYGKEDNPKEQDSEMIDIKITSTNLPTHRSGISIEFPTIEACAYPSREM